MSQRDELVTALGQASGHPLATRSLAGGELLVDLSADRLISAAETLLQAEPPVHLSAITAVAEGDGVALLYHFWAGGGLTLRLCCAASGGQAPSLTPILPGADWYEREVHDLFGIVFTGHPNLVSLLLSPDWEGPPPFSVARPAP
jgi:NADH:ubiquinone oxidoreductase subunit C